MDLRLNNRPTLFCSLDGAWLTNNLKICRGNLLHMDLSKGKNLSTLYKQSTLLPFPSGRLKDHRSRSCLPSSSSRRGSDCPQRRLREECHHLRRSIATYQLMSRVYRRRSTHRKWSPSVMRQLVLRYVRNEVGDELKVVGIFNHRVL